MSVFFKVTFRRMIVLLRFLEWRRRYAVPQGRESGIVACFGFFERDRSVVVPFFSHWILHTTLSSRVDHVGVRRVSNEWHAVQYSQ